MAIAMSMPMPVPVRRIEMIASGDWLRMWSDEDKAALAEKPAGFPAHLQMRAGEAEGREFAVIARR